MRQVNNNYKINSWCWSWDKLNVGTWRKGVRLAAVIGEKWNLFLSHLTQMRATSLCWYLCFASQWDNPFSVADNGDKQQFKWRGFGVLSSYFSCKVVVICNRVAVNIKLSELWTIKNTLYLSHTFWLWNCPWQVQWVCLLCCNNYVYFPLFYFFFSSMVNGMGLSESRILLCSASLYSNNPHHPLIR